MQYGGDNKIRPHNINMVKVEQGDWLYNKITNLISNYVEYNDLV